MSRRSVHRPRTQPWLRSLLGSLPTRQRRSHRAVGWRSPRGSDRSRRPASVPGLRSVPRGRPQGLSSKLQATVRIAVALGLLALVNLYVLYYRRGTSLPELIQQASDGRRASLSPRLSGPPGTPPAPRPPSRRARPALTLPDYPRVVDLKLKPGDTWRAVLPSLQLPARVQAELETALIALQDPGGLGAGQTLTAFYDSDDRLIAADYRLTPSMAYHLERVAIGSAERFVSSRQAEALTVRPTRVEVVLERPGDLTAALVRAGETAALSARLGEVVAGELDLLAEGQAGDRVRLVVEKHLLGGRFYRYGRLLALELVPRAAAGGASGARRLRAFLPPGTGPSNAGASPGAASLYFTETGESLGRALGKAPLLWTRAPAPGPTAAPGQPLPPPPPGPGRPGLHAERGRLGFDYVAPLGTPVVALGAGKVALRGPRGPHGLTVAITHAGGIETSYQHLLRLPRGLTEGAQVRARQIIGYVGQSGDARKPHLHVSVRANGRLVDPMTALGPRRATREAPLPDSRRAAFAEAVAELTELLQHPDGEAPALVLQQRPAEAP
ncbi:MAG: M23 family metallopeptidase [Polyangia bacterium]